MAVSDPHFQQSETAPLRYLRLHQVLDRIPVSKSTFWAGINTGRFPAPTHIGRIAVWEEGEIHRIMLSIKAGGM